MKKKKSTPPLVFRVYFPTKGISNRFNGITRQLQFVSQESEVGTVTTNDYMLHKQQLVVPIPPNGFHSNPSSTELECAVWTRLVSFLQTTMAPQYIGTLHLAGYMHVIKKQYADLPEIVYTVLYDKKVLCLVGNVLPESQ